MTYAEELSQADEYGVLDWNCLGLAQASLDVTGIPEIGAWTLPVKLASQRVMENLGFRYGRDFEFAGGGVSVLRAGGQGEWKG